MNGPAKRWPRSRSGRGWGTILAVALFGFALLSSDSAQAKGKDQVVLSGSVDVTPDETVGTIPAAVG